MRLVDDIPEVHALRKSKLTNVEQIPAENKIDRKTYVTDKADGTVPSNRCELASSGDVVFVHLYGPLEVVHQRLGERRGHFMPASLLQSQYDTLERPDPTQERVLELSVEDSIEHNIQTLCRTLKVGTN